MEIDLLTQWNMGEEETVEGKTCSVCTVVIQGTGTKVTKPTGLGTLTAYVCRNCKDKIKGV